MIRSPEVQELIVRQEKLIMIIERLLRGLYWSPHINQHLIQDLVNKLVDLKD